MKHLTIVFIVIAILGLGGAGYFFYQNQGLLGEVARTKDEKAAIEKELAVLKNTDLAKENERLESKLKSTEDTLFAEKEDHVETKSQLKTAEAKIKNLETAFSKIKPYVDVVSAFNHWEHDASPFPILDRDVSKIDAAVSSLGDTAVADLWRKVKAGFPQARQTGAIGHEEVITLIISRIFNLLK